MNGNPIFQLANVMSTIAMFVGLTTLSIYAGIQYHWIAFVGVLVAWGVTALDPQIGKYRHVWTDERQKLARTVLSLLLVACLVVVFTFIVLPHTGMTETVESALQVIE